MEIRIESPQFSTTRPIGNYLKARLHRQLAFCAERVRGVEVHLADVNGDRGGADKRCRLVVYLNRAREVVAESTQSDLYLAIRHATERVGRAARRRIARQAIVRRPHRQPPGDDDGSRSTA